MQTLNQNLLTIEDDLVAAFSHLGPLEREGLWRALLTPCGDALREAVRLRLRRMVAFDGGEAARNLPLADIRRALDAMPWDCWEALNAAVFELSRGNVFDDKAIPLEGGGILHEFGQGPRWQQFLALLDEEQQAVGEGASLLDVGCWQGTLLCEALQRGWSAAGTDITAGSRETVEHKIGLLRCEDRARFEGFIGPGAAHDLLPVDTRHVGLVRGRLYDVVACQETLEHVPTRFLQETCDAILAVARHSVLVTAPGWDDGWTGHLRVFTEDDFRRLFHADRYKVEMLVPPGGGVYTTVRVRK